MSMHEKDKNFLIKLQKFFVAKRRDVFEYISKDNVRQVDILK
jgi:hypothetical protein